MGYRELSRMEIVEVVRRWQAGESQRGIARVTGLARETVSKYQAAEARWGAIDAIADALRGVRDQLTLGVLLLSFGNAVGLFRAPRIGEVDVVSWKANQQQFAQLLSELMRWRGALPFAAAVDAALPFDRIS